MPLHRDAVKAHDITRRDNIKATTNSRPKSIVMAKKVTVQELHTEIEQIKDIHLGHMSDNIDELKEAVKENKAFFIGRLDRLDNRIFWILGLAFTTLLTVVGTLIGDMR